MKMKFTEVNTRRYNVSSARLTDKPSNVGQNDRRYELQRKLFEKKMQRNAQSGIKDTGWYVVK
jgi:hypothetical protein